MRVLMVMLVLWIFAGLFSIHWSIASDLTLPALNADPGRVSVSGLSSGGFMAVQYGVAYSASTMGIGVVAGGPYSCAYVNGGIIPCTRGVPDGAASYTAARRFAARGQIDPVENLTQQRIYLFSGTRDPIVKSTVMDAVFNFFIAAHVPASSIQYVHQMPAGHAFLSPSFGNDCTATAPPYVNVCAMTGTPAGSKTPTVPYDQPHAILSQIYGPLRPRATSPSSRPVAFEQMEFVPAGMADMSSMAERGYVYVPASCADGGSTHCGVHIVFHGCEQDAQTVQDAVFGKLGFNEWADSNDLIVLYPQLVKSEITPVNPHGCWDWWSYSGPDFQVRSGVQLSAVHAMVVRLTTGQ